MAVAGGCSPPPCPTTAARRATGSMKGGRWPAACDGWSVAPPTPRAEVGGCGCTRLRPVAVSHCTACAVPLWGGRGELTTNLPPPPPPSSPSAWLIESITRLTSAAGIRI
eukprot:scaffold2554_cov321-Prasinococcus_capsulatus_cf.AAC.2